MWRTHFLEQQTNMQQLRAALSNKQLAHAILYYGNEGTGALAHALETSLTIFCSNVIDQIACGECVSCKKVLHLNHPDLHFLLPTIGSKVKSTDFYPQWRTALAENPYLSAFDWLQHIDAENKQGNITSADCLNAYNQLGMQAFEGGAKVLIIWMAEYLGKEGNKLLKLIEEPPEGSSIFIITENREAILPTVLSRCQHLFFKPYDQSMVESYLVEKLGTEASKARAITEATGGNFNLAIRSLEYNTDHFFEKWVEWIKVSYKGSAGEKVAWSDIMGRETRENQKQFMRYCLTVLRKVLVQSREMNGSEKMEKMNAFLRQRLDITEIGEITQILDQNIHYILRNANGRILWLDSTIKFGKILRQEARVAVSSL